MIVSVAEEMNPAWRYTMEDVHVYHRAGTWKHADPHLSYLGVYDGHGGRHIADFLDVALASNVARECNHDDAGITEKLERAFLVTDLQSRKLGLMESGSTVAICLIHTDPNSDLRILTTANVGDSRVVLGRRTIRSESGVAVRSVERLSYDHSASDETEVDRIEEAGGLVVKGRVMGLLAVARSMGDHSLKDFVSATPFVSESVRAKKGDIVILACDGLWDVMTDKEAVLEASKFEIAEERMYDAAIARHLIDIALARGSTDNITVMVAFI